MAVITEKEYLEISKEAQDVLDGLAQRLSNVTVNFFTISKDSFSVTFIFHSRPSVSAGFDKFDDPM